MINEKNNFLTVSWLSGLLSAEIFISTGEWGVQMPPLTSENSYFLRSGPQGATLVMKDKIWQKARDKKHFIRDEIYWWQRERTLMGHAHILWVLLSAARIAVLTLNYITYHVAESVGVWNGLCAPASKPSNLLNSCVFILDAL